MSKHRLFIDPRQVAADRIELDRDQAHRLGRVLRLGRGDRVYLLDGSGRRSLATIESIDRTGGAARLADWEPFDTEPGCRVTLYQALIKADRFEWALQKGTEVGVATFVPLLTDRCVVPAPSQERLDRWRAIVREAAEQSGRSRLPELTEPKTLGEIEGPSRPLIVLWEAERNRRLRDVLAQLAAGLKEIGLVIGPVGGLTEAEVGRLASAGADVAGLGPRLLRAETAGPIVAALVLSATGDLG